MWLAHRFQWGSWDQIHVSWLGKYVIHFHTTSTYTYKAMPDYWVFHVWHTHIHTHTHTHTHTHKAMLDYCFMHAILFNTLRKHSVCRLLTLRSSAQQPFKTALKRLEDETSCKFMQHHMLPNLVLKRRRFNLRKWWLCLPLTLTKTPLKKRQDGAGRHSLCQENLFLISR